MAKKKIAILATSFDGFCDLWDPLDKNFEIYVDENIPCYLMTNFLKPNLKNLNYIDIGKDLSWTENLNKVLDKLSNYEYILLTLDDTFFKKRVNYSDLQKYCNEMKKYNANYLSLLNRPSAKLKKLNNTYSFVCKDSFYPVSAGLCIWKISELRNYLNINKTAWEYEENFKIDDESKFMSLNYDFQEIINAVVKGKLYPSAVRQLEKQKIFFETQRAKYSNITEISHSIKSFFRSIFIRLFLTFNLVSLLKYLRNTFKR